MNLNVTFRHLPSSDALREHVKQKAQKVQKYLDDPIDIHAVLEVEKNRQIAEFQINAKDFRGHAVEESSDMYASIDVAMSKIESQARKFKEKITEHKGIEVENNASIA
ncbi:MAG: ribosome-associated translation inhibitor RaiA [Deltaproteobacteria bacterium]|nr:ribosome-associated translation inhibitor RaiA [Deltaproteobacteria bacterium]